MQTTFTTSMPAAAFAIACGCGKPRLEEFKPGRCKFIFDDPYGEVSQRIVAYFNGEDISGCEFYKALSNLRVAVNLAKGGAR